MNRKVAQWWNNLLKHKKLIVLSLVLLAVAAFLEYLSGLYVARTPGANVPDLILDNVPTFNFGIFFVYGGAVSVALLLLYPLVFKIKEFHKVISQFSLLVLVRSLSITLTHLNPPMDALKFHVPWWFAYFTFQNDMFFSGHTAIPFLGFLLFKNSKIRYLFLALSIFMGATVLLIHVHYSIDVFAAFFITYGTFKMGEWIFNKVNHYGNER